MSADLIGLIEKTGLIDLRLKLKLRSWFSELMMSPMKKILKKKNPLRKMSLRLKSPMIMTPWKCWAEHLKSF